MPEKAEICIESTTTVPLATILKSPDLTKGQDMTKLCQELTGHNLLEKKGLKMAKNTKNSIAFYERYLLTVEEASAYFHIGYKKMRNMDGEFLL